MTKKKGLVLRRIASRPSRKLAVACPFCGKKLSYRSQGPLPKEIERPWSWIFEYAERRRCPRCDVLFFVRKDPNALIFHCTLRPKDRDILVNRPQIYGFKEKRRLPHYIVEILDKVLTGKKVPVYITKY